VTANIYVPLWVPAAVFCLACLAAGLPDDIRKFKAWIRHRRTLNRLWDDRETVGGWASSDRGPATTPAARPYDWDAA